MCWICLEYVLLFSHICPEIIMSKGIAKVSYADMRETVTKYLLLKILLRYVSE